MKNRQPKCRKDILVENIKTAEYEAFLSKKDHSKKDLQGRLENILAKDRDLNRIGAESQIPTHITNECRSILSSKPTKEAMVAFPVQVVRCRQTPGVGSAFIGGALTSAEIDKLNAARALNLAIQKVSPASIEQASLLHVKYIIKACMKLNGRDSEKYLQKVVPCIIQYLYSTLCNKQAQMSEQVHVLAAKLRKSQTELQFANKALSNALMALHDFTENPSQPQKCQTATEALHEAVQVAKDEQ